MVWNSAGFSQSPGEKKERLSQENAELIQLREIQQTERNGATVVWEVRNTYSTSDHHIIFKKRSGSLR